MKSDSHRDESKLTHPVSEHPDRQPANISHGSGEPSTTRTVAAILLSVVSVSAWCGPASMVQIATAAAHK
jgi:hypothetical protein